MKVFNVVFFGTPDFSIPALEMLANHPNINLSYVISMPDRPAGRGQNLKSPPVINYAKENKLPFFQTENINKEEEFINKLEKEKIDFFVVLAFAQFLGKRVLDLPKIAPFNIHTSLLPKYRGAAPIQYALLNGDNETGVSIQRMVKKMDAGDLVKDTKIDIASNETGGQLYTRLKFQAALTLNELITDLLNDQVTYVEQNEEDVSFAPTLKKEDGHLKFSEEKFETIFNKIRALKPWPGTFCFLGKKRLKVIEIQESEYSIAPGKCEFKHNQLLVGCSDKTARITTLQLEGKKKCSDLEFANGFNRTEELILS